MTREPQGADPPVLELRDVSVGYEGRSVLDGVSLSVGAGEVLALLGPSGSGKTSLLHAIAGFLEPLGGQILIRGQLVAGEGRSLPPEDRRVGVVFQALALWPHLSAVDTVAYPMRRDGRTRADAAAAAAGLLERLSIGHLAARRPAELSGGEQQRVALARALARAPHLFLLDEPTAHLDATLRAALQDELAASRQDGVAALHATHDVGEAMATADRVAVLHGGRISQVGSPTEVYDRPVDEPTAAITGPVSLLDAELVAADGRTADVRIGESVSRVDCAAARTGPALLLVRPDWAQAGSGAHPALVAAVRYHGPYTEYRLRTDAGSLLVRENGPPRFAVGERIRWALARVWPLPAQGAPLG